MTIKFPLVSLGKYSEFRNGLNFSASSYGKGVRFIGVADFQDYFHPHYHELKQVNPKGIVKNADYLQDGDIIFVRSNGNKALVGRSLFIQGLNDKVVFSGFCIRLRIVSSSLNPLFCAYYVRSEIFRKMLSSVAGGANIQNLNQTMLSKAKIPFPEYKTQQKIAHILSAYDDLIENNLKRIKRLEEMAQITYEQWFVRMKFPNHENTAIDNKTGLPVGWKIKEIRDFGEVITGKTPSTSNEEYYGGNIPFIKTPDMNNSPYVLETSLQLSKKGADSQKGKYLPKNSLLVSCIGTAGVVALTQKNSQFNQQINAIIFKTKTDAYFLYCFARLLKPLLEALGSNGATMTNVNKSKFEKIKVITPTSDLLKDFGEKHSSNFKTIESLLLENQLLKEARDILLPRLMTGIIDVDKITVPNSATDKTQTSSI